MKESVLLVLFGIVLIAGAVLSGCRKQSVVSSAQRSAKLTINDKMYQIELSRTPQEQEQGLSDRKEIGSDGMLFVFSQSGIKSFWMKDMLFDLDFIWMSEGKVVEITRDVPKPQDKRSDLPIYKSAKSVDMMLEVNAGFANKENITVGDAVELIQ